MSRKDTVVSALLMAATVVYLISLPHNLGMTDESNLLYESKRLADGEIMYRDVFDIISPVSLYLTALVFRVFGTDMGVARAMIAVVHGVIVVAIYACSRLLGVRPTLAAVAAATHVALAQPAWPFVSQHWFATAATLLVLLSLLRTASSHEPRWPLVPGVLTGVLIGIQHQRGVPLTLGLCGLFVALHACRRWYHGAPPHRVLAQQLGYLALGVALAAVPPFAVLIVVAGLQPLVRALIIFPLVNYRKSYRSAWGGVQFMTAYYASFTFPALLKWAPVSVLSVPFRILVAGVRRRDPRTVEQLITLFIFALCAAASIAYYPDFVHIAFIAPVFLIALVETIDWILRAVPASRVAAIGGSLIAACAAFAIAARLQGNWTRAWATFPVPYDTAFGRIDLLNRSSIPPIDKARALLAESPKKDMFCYPAISGPYLMTGAKNPTPYQFLATNYHDPEQVQEILAILDAQRTPFVMTSPLYARKGGPIVDYIDTHYDYVDVGSLPNLFLYARKHDQ